MSRYTVHQAKTHLSRLIAEALEGQEVVIARAEVPVVRLTPMTPAPRRQFGAMKGQIALDPSFFDPLPGEELEGWSLG